MPYREMSWWSYRNRGQKIEAIEDSHAGDLAVQRLGPWQPRSLPLRPGRSAWVHVVRGTVVAQDAELSEGDGAAITDEESVNVTGKDAAELLIFDLA
jgi:quercetin 2,3-dioxygenase